MPSLTKVVAENLRIARDRRKLSQQVVAQKAGLAVSYISMLERGERTPSLEALEALSNALTVAPVDLFESMGTSRRRSGKR